MECLRYWKITGFTRAFQLKGRASLKEIWYWLLLNIIVQFSLLYIYAMTLFQNGAYREEYHFNFAPILALLFTLYSIIPSLTLGVRRLHDTNRSGLMLLLVIIPAIGPLILFFLTYIATGTLGDNDYGPRPEY